MNPEEQPIEIHLSSAKNQQLDESFLRMFGSAVKTILRAMFSGDSIPVTVKGSNAEIKAFADVLGSEKRFIDAYNKVGLNNPITYQSKFKLNKAVSEFERMTGIEWPLK